MYSNMKSIHFSVNKSTETICCDYFTSNWIVWGKYRFYLVSLWLILKKMYKKSVTAKLKNDTKYLLSTHYFNHIELLNTVSCSLSDRRREKERERVRVICILLSPCYGNTVGGGASNTRATTWQEEHFYRENVLQCWGHCTSVS